MKIISQRKSYIDQQRPNFAQTNDNLFLEVNYKINYL